MKRKLKALFAIFIFLSIGTTSISVNSIKTITLPVHNCGETIYVDDNNTIGPWDGTKEHPFRYIQDGINVSEDNDTVFVCNGTYYENIEINKSINLLGEEETILDGMNNDILVDVISKDVTIQNFTIRNSGGYVNNAGIKLGSNNNVIKNCVIYRTKTGIYVNNSSFNRINNCTFHTNGVGIFLETSDNNIIEGCCFSHNSIGIHLESSFNNLIKYSYLHTNGLACFFNDSEYIAIYHCNISDNSDNHGGIFLKDCSNISVKNCILRHNGMGINIANSNRVYVKNSSLILNTHFALFVKKTSYGVEIVNCEIKQNFRYGIYLIEDSECKAVNNNFEENRLHGAYIKSSICDARFNWWGSPFGPSLTELGKTTKITFKPRQLKILPFECKPLENVGANWLYNECYMIKAFHVTVQRVINLSGKDTDNDGIPDWWEEKYEYNPNKWNDHANIDPDHDGLNNIEECYTDCYGSQPYNKDIFLEIDWVELQNTNMPCNKPPGKLLNNLVKIFRQHNITLHIDTGDMDGGETVPYVSNFSFPNLQDLYWDYFLHNNLDNPRKGIFHYALVCDYGPDINFPFIGWDHLDSCLISAQWLRDIMPYFSRNRLIVGGLVHQLGSQLGLLADTHGGNDNLESITPLTLQWWKYKNYKSCMNYYYKYRLMSYSDGTHGHGDFNDWENLDFTFFKNSHFEWPRQ